MADDEASAARAALDRLERAYDEATAEIESAPDGRGAFRLATELAEAVAHMSEVAGKLRAAMAVRIADEESLSLAALAGKLSMSKARAAQLVRSGRATPRPGAQQEGPDNG
jgi:hypothetical protein